jgi:hypothetical protein
MMNPGRVIEKAKGQRFNFPDYGNRISTGIAESVVELFPRLPKGIIAPTFRSPADHLPIEFSPFIDSRTSVAPSGTLKNISF